MAERASRELPEAKPVNEFGRHLIRQAGIYVTRIIDRKAGTTSRRA